ncbi:hypothetical protein IAR55_001285 [Kwoniella newhampshirensis]|uniref:Uncharacterized protein n=1 Tax=Kwoniella newhampshirensis TaxID=1651941 RepID=A0AAW0Z577_9TREE
MDLGAPIGATPSGEHGRGTGLSGGHGIPTSANTQAGKFAAEERGSSGFNGGVGGEHASAGIPKTTNTQFTSPPSGGVEPYGSSTTGHHGHGKLDNSLDHFEGEQRGGAMGTGIGSGRGNVSSGITGALDGEHHHSSSHHHHSHGTTGQETVSGAYAGTGTRDALTGESNAHSTGAGVGPLAENLHSGSTGTGSHPHGPRDAALAGTAAGAGALAGGAAHSHSRHSGADAGVAAPLTRGEGVAGYGQGQVPGVGGERGSGVGPSDGSTAGGVGYGGSSTTGAGAGTGHGLAAGGTAAGVGAAGVGAAGIGAGHSGSKTGSSTAEQGSHSHNGQSHKDLDTGGPHSLVFQESTGQYVHRRDL